MRATGWLALKGNRQKDCVRLTLLCPQEMRLR